jgi:purine-binding chemotaxis protein CheW
LDLEENNQLVVFKLGVEFYGVFISQVKEIIKISEISKIPEMPVYIPGVINLRGKITVIYDLRARFEMGNKEYDENTRIIVINDRSLGFIVDEVNEIIHIEKDNFENGSCLPADINKKFIAGLVKSNGNVIVVLRLNDVLSVQESELVSAQV